MHERRKVPEWVAAALLAAIGAGCIIGGFASPFDVSRIMLIDAEGGPPEEVAFSRQHDYFQMDWSPEGVITYTANPGDDLDIFTLSRRYTSSRIITQNLTDDLAPSVRGEQILYTARDDTDYEIVIRDNAERRLFRLTNNDYSDVSAVWSPDGAQIAFATAQTGQLEIAVMDADGENVRILTETPNGASFPTWSPDGAMLAYQVQDEANNVDVWVIPAEGGTPTRLTDSPAFDGFPRWSPGGEVIAFQSERGGDEEVWLMAADGSSPRNLTQAPQTADGYPAWSPDGAQILYRSAGPQPRWAMIGVGAGALALAAVVTVVWWRGR